MQKVFSIFAQNLAYYNEGYLVGDWIDLLQSPEVIDKYLKDVVKIDDEHEEYEIADVENILPFSYKSIQWSNIKDINNLAIYSTLDEGQKEAVEAFLAYDTEDYDIDKLINICLQADDIDYCRYNFNGIEHCKDCSPELKMGYTMAEELGIYYELEKIGVTDYFDFEKYGESYSFNHELFENGYLIPDNYNVDVNLYSKEEIKERVEQILQENIKEMEIEDIEI